MILSYKSKKTFFTDKAPVEEGTYVFRGVGSDECEESLLYVSQAEGEWIAFSDIGRPRKVADMSGYWLALPFTPREIP